MLNTYIVTYDIRDPKRLREVYQCMRGWGDHLQYSVFLCKLNAADLIRLRSDLSERVNLRVDQVLFFDLGPAEGRARKATISLGTPYTYPERHVTVV